MFHHLFAKLPVLSLRKKEELCSFYQLVAESVIFRNYVVGARPRTPGESFLNRETLDGLRA